MNFNHLAKEILDYATSILDGEEGLDNDKISDLYSRCLEIGELQDRRYLIGLLVELFGFDGTQPSEIENQSTPNNGGWIAWVGA